MYSVIWKYTVSPEFRPAFEKEYGSRGSWYELFSRSSLYKGSFLYQNPEDEGSYILTDNWENREAYDEFLISFRVDYSRLSDRLKFLHQSEQFLGGFTVSPGQSRSS